MYNAMDVRRMRSEREKEKKNGLYTADDVRAMRGQQDTGSQKSRGPESKWSDTTPESHTNAPSTVAETNLRRAQQKTEGMSQEAFEAANNRGRALDLLSNIATAGRNVNGNALNRPAYDTAISMLQKKAADKRTAELEKNGVESSRARELASDWGNVKRAKDIQDQAAYDKKKQAYLEEAGDEKVSLMRQYLTGNGRERQAAWGRMNELGMWNPGGESEDFALLKQYVQEELDKERTEEHKQDVKDFVESHPVAGSIIETAGIPGARLLGGPMAAVESLRSAFYTDKSAPVNTNSRLYGLQNWADAAQESVGEQAGNLAKNNIMKHPVGIMAYALGMDPEQIRAAAGEAGTFLYDTGVSTATSALSMAVGGEVAGALGLEGAAATKVAEAITLPMFGTEAFASTVKEMQENGYSKKQAIATAFGAGISEMLFEKLSLDRAWDSFMSGQMGKNSARRLVMNILAGSGIEGLEEVCTDVANHMVDAAVNGEFSDYNTRVQMLIDSGADPETARNEVLKDYAWQTLLSFAGGAISGGLMNAGSSFAGQVHYHNTAREILLNEDLTNRLLQTARESMPEDSTARKIADEVSDGQVSEKQMSQILESMSEVAADQNETGMEGLLQREFEKLGEDSETAAANAQKIIEMASTEEEEVTDESEEAIANELEQNENLASVYEDYRSGKVDEVSRTVENAYQEVAEQKENRKRAAVKFESVEAGKEPMVKTADGRTVPMTEAHVDPKMKSLWSMASKTENTAAANAMIEDYKGENLRSYALASYNFFNEGRIGVTPFEVLLGDKNSSFDIAQNKQAHLLKMYNLGQNAAQAEKVTEEPGRLSDRASELGKVTDLRTDKSDQRPYDLAMALSRKTGLNFTLKDSLGADKNGSFVASLGRVAISAEGDNQYGTMIHELSEFGKSYAPEKMDQLIEKVLDYANTSQGMDGLLSQLEAYRDTYRKVEAGKTLEQAGEEYVYDYLGALFMTEDGQKAFQNWLSENATEQEQKSIAQTMYDLFAKIAEMIKEFLTTGHINPGTKSGLRADAKKAEEIRDMWKAVIDEASENLRSQMEDRESGGEEKESHSTQIKYEESVNEDLLEYIDEYEKDPNRYMSPFVFDGEISERLASKIQELLMVSADGYKHELAKNQLRHIEKEHGKNGRADSSMADPKDIARIKYVLDEFDNVVKGDKKSRAYSNRDGSAADTIVIQKKIGDKFYYVIEAVPDTKKKRLGIITAYINNKDTLSRVGNADIPAVYVQNGSESHVSVNSTIPNDTKKSSEKNSLKVPSEAKTDSTGKELSADQLRYFANSKVRDNQGRLMAMYHGTPNGDFTVFREGSYFSDMEWYADKYQSQGASMLSYKKDAKAPKTYAVYLNIEKPFDTRLPEVRKVFEEQFYRKYGTGTPLQENGLPDWTDAEDLREFIEENGLDYDGIIVDEGGFPDGKGGVTSRGVSYIPMNGREQVKSIDNKKPTKNEDIRFSLAVPVEETKDLIALHNLSEEKLLGALRLGGFPMPSIAVTKRGMLHDKFGNISVLFSKDTIDPKATKANRVYSGDAYTPTFPRVGYKVNEKKLNEINARLKEILGDQLDAFGYLGLDKDNVADYLERNSGDAAEAYSNKEALKYAYVKDKGLDFKVPMRQAPLSWDFDNAVVKAVANRLTKSPLEIYQNSSASYKEFEKDGSLQVILDLINEWEKETYGDHYEKFRTKEISFSDFDHLMNAVVRYEREGIRQEVDKAAFSKEIDKVLADRQEDYREWLKDLFDGIVAKRGIRNSKDAITNTVNRRSWDSLYDEYTLENIVKAMKAEPEVGQSLGGYTLLGSVNRTFDSIKDIHSAEDRLQMISDDEYSQLRQEIQDDLYAVAKHLVPNPGYDVLSICSDIAEAAAKRKTRSGIKSFLSEWYKVSDEDMDEIMRIIDQAKSLPTGYFEAKPRRAIGLDEIASVIVPSNAEQELLDELDAKNVPYTTYKAGDKEDRLNVLNRVADEEKAAFSLKVPDKKDVKFSITVSSVADPYNDDQKDFWKNSKKIVLFENEAQFDKFVQDAWNGTISGQKLYIGRVNHHVAQQIKNATGLDVEGFNISIPADNVRKIRKSHGSAATEVPRGQVPIVPPDDFKEIVDVLDRPDSIDPPTKYEGKDAFYIRKDGTSVFFVINGNALDIYPQTMFKHKKRNPTPVANAQALAATPKATQKTVPNLGSSIPNSTDKSTHSLDVWDDEIIDEELDKDIEQANSILQEGIEAAKDLEVDAKIVRKVAKDIKDLYRPTMKLGEVEQSIGRVFAYLQSSGSSSKEDLLRIMKEVAEPILEETEGSPEAKEAYDNFRNYFKGRKVRLTATQKEEVKYRYGSLQEFRNRLWGAGITISDNGTPLDVLWPEIADMAKGYIDHGANEGEMPGALDEAVSVLRSGLIDHDTDSEAYAYDLAIDIYRRYFEEKARQDNDVQLQKKAEKIAQGQQAFLRKQAKKYQERYREAQNRLKKEREINLARIADEIEALTEEQQKALMEGDLINEAYLGAQKTRYEEQLKTLREQRDDKVAQVRSQAAVSKRRAAEERRLTEYKERLRRNVDELNKMLAHPTEKSHIPADLIKATIDTLSAINMDTGNNQATRERLKRLGEVYDKYKDDTTFQFDYDERTAENIKRLQELFKNRNYTFLSSSELREVIDIVRALKKQIRDTNKLVEMEKYQYAKETAKEAVDEVRNARRVDNGLTNALDAYADVHLNSYRWFRKTFGYKNGAGLALWKGLDEGQQNMLQIQREINDIFRDVLEGKENQKEVKKLISTKEEDLVDIGLTDDDGLPVKVTRAMRLSAIMHSMNKGNLRHMVAGGLTVPVLDLYAKNPAEAYARGRVYQFVDTEKLIKALKEGDIETAERYLGEAEKKIKALVNDLSPWEEAFLQRSMRMFHEYTGNKVNETSLKLKGYALARVKDYFPIKTDPNFVATDLSGLVRDGSLEGMGFLKERVFSKKPMLLEDITNVIARQTKNVSMYAGLAIPLRNLNMVLNQTYFDEKNQRRSVKEAIRNTWGDRNQKWLQNLMQDLQGGRSNDDNFLGHFMDALRGHYAGAVLTLNPSVAIKQASSYPTAAAVLGWGPLAKAMKDMGKGFAKQQGLPELEERNPLLWHRTRGYASQDLADIKEHGGIMANLPKGLKWIEWMDAGTVRTLEYACKYWVDANTDLKEGTPRYWDKVSEMFTKVVEETQPNYTTLQQADIIRNPNKFLKQIIMFKTQPMQNFGIVYDAIGNLNAKMHGGSPEEIKEAKENFARAVSSQVVSSIVFSAMTILASLILHRQYKYKDDEGKVTPENLLKALGEGMLSNVTGALVLGSEIYEGLRAILTGDTYYGIDASTLEMVTDIVKNTQSLVSNTEKLADAVTEEEHDKAGFQVAKSAEKLLMTLAQFGGLPLNNVKNILKSMYQYEEDVRTGQPLGTTESRTANDIDKQYKRMADALIAGNTERYDKLYRQMAEGKDKSDSAIQSGVTTQIKEMYEAGELTRDEAENALVDLGKTPDEAYFKLEEWGYDGEGSYGQYKGVFDTIDNALNGGDRRAIEREVKELTDHGKTESAIASQITKEYKPQYLEAKSQGKAADLKNILLTAYQCCGLSRDEALKKIESWK